MMAPEPLKSVILNQTAEDTSLALPSDSTLRLGQQRVLHQVHSIKRTKSRQSKSDSLSPTPISPISQSLSEFGTFKFSPSKANGTASRFISNSYSSMGIGKGQSHTLSKTSSARQFSSSGVWDQQFKGCIYPMKPSLSDPSLAPPFSPTSPTAGTFKSVKGQVTQGVQSRVNRHSTYSMTNGSQLNTSQPRLPRPPSGQFQIDGKMGTLKPSRIEQKSFGNSSASISDLTLKEAVEYLSHPAENYQQCGATFIQHTTYKEDHTKQEVLELGGIPGLVSLLQSPNVGVSQAAAGALRNLVFKHQGNKLEFEHCGGVAKALQLLKATDSTEVQKQITGLLWNVSAADELKDELIATALPALTENVVMPFTNWSDSIANNNIHPEVFYNATGCLRNLSSGKERERNAMRKCTGLIDSLASYVQSCVAEDNPDDKSVENCVCILHNLTYELDDECPTSFEKLVPKTEVQTNDTKNQAIGCFSPRSGKIQKEFLLDMAKRLPISSDPSGPEWLWHPTTMQNYLSLLSSSKKEATLEASCGALQNLTATNGLTSSIISQILVQKLEALVHVSPHLKSSNRNLQKAAMALVGNMSQSSALQSTMTKQILPDVTSLVSAGPRALGSCDKTIAAACNTVRSLMLADTDTSKKLIDNGLVTSLTDLSENGAYPKGCKAASLLLYTLWDEKALQGAARKLGNKSTFVNDHTTAAHRSVQVID
ncbi:uncharacterized protein V6R79_014747 [Siganus canaliculatus]